MISNDLIEDRTLEFSKDMVKCPFCGGSNVDFADEVDLGKEMYYCRDCDEFFYTHFAKDVDGVIKLHISKEKWKNFKPFYQITK